MQLSARVAFVGALTLGLACQSSTPPTVGQPPSATASAVQGPDRPIELVIPAPRATAGIDTDARFLRDLLEQSKVVIQPIQPVNREGAAAVSFLATKRGNMNYLMLFSSALFATLATTTPPLDVTELTPIANIALEPALLWVAIDSPWRSAKDLLAAAKTSTLVVSGAGSRQDDEVVFRRIQALAATRPFLYVALPSAGDALAALATHQAGVVATVTHPAASVSIPAATRARLRPLCSFTPDPLRSGAYAGLPTCASQELHLDDVYAVRAVVAAPGLTAAQEAFWVDVVRRTAGSVEWQRYAEQAQLLPELRVGADVRALLGRYQQIYRDVARANGWGG